MGHILVVGVSREQLLQPDTSAQFKKGVSDHVNFVANSSNAVRSTDVGVVRFEEISVGTGSSCSSTVSSLVCAHVVVPSTVNRCSSR